MALTICEKHARAEAILREYEPTCRINGSQPVVSTASRTSDFYGDAVNVRFLHFTGRRIMQLLQDVEVEIGSWVMIRGSSHCAKKSYSLSTPFWIGKVMIVCRAKCCDGDICFSR